MAHDRRPADPYGEPARPLSERDLFDGYGVCGRCGGSGTVELAPGRLASCRRCEGTGVKVRRRGD